MEMKQMLIAVEGPGLNGRTSAIRQYALCAPGDRLVQYRKTVPKPLRASIQIEALRVRNRRIAVITLLEHALPWQEVL